MTCFLNEPQDLKLLLLRFAEGKSFSEETGGGGKESNIQLIPCLTMLPLYQLTTTQTAQNEERGLKAFLDTSQPADWVAQSFTIDGPLYQCVLASVLFGPKRWKENRINFLKRIIVLSQARKVIANGANPKLTDAEIKEWTVYKPYCLFFALVDGIYSVIYKSVRESEGTSWPQELQNYLQQNDIAALDGSKKLLKFFEEDLSCCESFDEFSDAAGILEDIGDSSDFLQSTLNMVKQS